jgi:N6-adenosine-specific RNA methylase IME4
VVSPRREHSRKPDLVYDRIEALCPGPYLEMFARSSRPQWDNWGTEAGLFDGGGVATRRWRSTSNPTTILASK